MKSSTASARNDITGDFAGDRGTEAGEGKERRGVRLDKEEKKGA